MTDPARAVESSRLADRPEYAATAAAILDALAPTLDALPARGLVLGVAGESGSGKTVTAVSLARALEARGLATVVLHQDDYFVRPPRANHEFRRGDLSSVGPQEVDLQRLQDHVVAFRERRAGVAAPQVDYANDRFVERTLDFSAARALVLEGTYAFLLHDLDVRIFQAATHEETRAHRAARARDVHEPFVDEVLRIEHDLIAAQAERADLVVDREFRVRRPADR